MAHEKSHREQIERWANYIKTHKDWRKFHKQFIDAQIELALKARRKLDNQTTSAIKQRKI